jgi:hypothetical protein
MYRMMSVSRPFSLVSVVIRPSFWVGICRSNQTTIKQSAAMQPIYSQDLTSQVNRNSRHRNVVHQAIKPASPELGAAQ